MVVPRSHGLRPSLPADPVQHSFTLEDLGSTNGTYVDDVRLPPRQPITVTRDSGSRWAVAVFRGRRGRRAQADAAQPGVIRIGRSPDSDVVLDYPMISWDHARILEQSGQFVLEDLDSSNGTAINEVENRIARATLQRGDDVYLGSFKIPATRLLTPRPGRRRRGGVRADRLRAAIRW